MKIETNDEAKVRLISRGTMKAEVVVRQHAYDGSTNYETRHLLLKGGQWRDNLGNVYHD